MLFPAFVLLLSSCAHFTGEMEGDSASYNFGHAVIHIYQHHLDSLSAVRVSSCPMHPSCSEYTKDAMEKHGLLIGWMMMVDRLYRCGRDETRLSPLIYIDGDWRYHDPVERNDFWWYSPSPAISCVTND